MRSDLFAFLQDGDRELKFLVIRFVVRLGQVREPVRGGQTGRAGADDHDIDVEGLTLDAGKFSHASSLRCAKSRHSSSGAPASSPAGRAPSRRPASLLFLSPAPDAPIR